VYVSGTLGDAAAGLALLQERQHDDFLVRRFLRPTARVALGRRLSGRAGGAIDVSDGLVGDLRKMLDASGVGARIDADKLPMSPALRERFGDEATDFALTGGDDYELCFTAAADAVADIEGITAIGSIVAGTDLECRRGGEIVEVDESGYRHFV
jgi:thiamine-monophosphate kinase